MSATPRRAAWVRQIAAALLLGGACVAAQTIAFAHDLDADSQAPGHVCEICIVAADLAGANVTAALVYSLPDRSHERPFVATVGRPLSHSFPAAARGPPAAS